MRYLFILLLIGQQLWAQKRVDTSLVLNIGGIRQYVRIKGEDSTRPLLLFLHGGPGSSLVKKIDIITGKLQQDFIVVHWDQRETGETKKLNPSVSPLNLQQFYSDTHDLADTLLRRFNKPKLYLVGYSWGSVLGFYMANQYPEMLYAYIAVSPVIDQWRSDSLSLAMLKETMGKKAQKELAQVKIPFENAEQLYYHRKWLLKQGGQKLISLSLPKNFVLQWAGTWFDIWEKACDDNRFKTIPVLRCPVYFLAGEKDYQTNHTITTAYYNMVSAPQKELYLFPGAGHELPETNSEAFQDTIINKILPATYRAR